MARGVVIELIVASSSFGSKTSEESTRKPGKTLWGRHQKQSCIALYYVYPETRQMNLTDVKELYILPKTAGLFRIFFRGQ
ncbi:hypothetical protein PENANT_c005G09933 [Penicillium antarcticum]|uniref:Uncharacterized protein n=1 Tax=Penicillium antarcticum TaxID=416450 RepID=A0A1V6QEK8_9EURO|nr:hypothetical protein PENANT_c005G09933 [Penicillium antarcticum]